MDPESAPNCCICNKPAVRGQECSCEAERLELAVRQAEQRSMEKRLDEIRDWVVNHSRTHILQAFERLSSRRKTAHNAYLSSLPFYSIYVQYHGTPPLHPTALNTLRAQIAEANAELKRGIDNDWRLSVLRYPEVLDYFYGLVELGLPPDRDSRVARPPFAVAGYADQGFEGGRLGKAPSVKKNLRTSARDPTPALPRPGMRRRDPPVQHGGGVAVARPRRPVAPTPPGGARGPYAPYDERQYYR
ncbi:hypothetical protein IWX90DRAFT_389804 [Phyllosticta citrichinensis]|uniref:Uncharacterized protein n=1 Tax=Phyllosticta citrichinensis TaxID=1130410 RepID=A0ABR1XM33_9PEZI